MKATLLPLDARGVMDPRVCPWQILLEEGDVKLMIIVNEVVEITRAEEGPRFERAPPGCPVSDLRQVLERWAASMSDKAGLAT